jgi:aldehyde dehydrogenase (NAD+)
MDQPTVGGLAERQRAFFRAGPTRDVAFRRRQLRVLRNAIVERDADLLAALKADLGRPAAEAYSSEIAVVLHEIDFASRRMGAAAKGPYAADPLPGVELDSP